MPFVLMLNGRVKYLELTVRDLRESALCVSVPGYRKLYARIPRLIGTQSLHGGNEKQSRYILPGHIWQEWGFHDIHAFTISISYLSAFRGNFLLLLLLFGRQSLQPWSRICCLLW